MTDFETLREEMRQFVTERDWQKFHDPKSLLLALTAEVGELCEQFQWLPAVDAIRIVRTEAHADAVADEMADVLLYLIALANTLGVDLVDVGRRKLLRNRERFPVAQTRGVAPGPHAR